MAARQWWQDNGDSKLHIDGMSLANPPPPPLYPVEDFSSSRKVHGTTRRATKVKFNGPIKSYKDGTKRQRKSSKIELEIEEATAVNGPDVLAKLKTLGFAIIKDYDALRVDGAYVYESLFAEGNKPTPEQAFFLRQHLHNTSRCSLREKNST
jgi:hypothetical protein